jgi:hypothetical protein
MYAPLEAADKEKGHTSGAELWNRVGTRPRPRTELNDVETDTGPNQCHLYVRVQGTCAFPSVSVSRLTDTNARL